MTTFRNTAEFISIRDLIAEFGGKEALDFFENSLFTEEDDRFIAYLVKKYGDPLLAGAVSFVMRNRDFGKVVDKMAPEDREALKKYGASDYNYSQSEHAKFDFGTLVESAVVMKHRWEVLNSIFQASGMERTAKVLGMRVISLPSGQLNAYAIASPSGRPLIVLNTFLFLFLPMVFTTLYAASGVAESRGELKVWRHERRDHCRTLVALALVAATGDYSFLKAAPTIHDLPDIVGWSVFCSAAVTDFVLMHEYAHVGFEDLKKTASAQETILPGLELDESIFPRSVLQEFRSDMFAAYVFVHHPTPSVNMLSEAERHAAVSVFFQFLSLTEYVRSRILGQQSDGSSHPPTHLRIRFVQNYTIGSGVETNLANALILVFQGAFAEVDILAEKTGKPSHSGSWEVSLNSAAGEKRSVSPNNPEDLKEIEDWVAAAYNQPSD